MLAFTKSITLAMATACLDIHAASCNGIAGQRCISAVHGGFGFGCRFVALLSGMPESGGLKENGVGDEESTEEESLLGCSKVVVERTDSNRTRTD